MFKKNILIGILTGLIMAAGLIYFDLVPQLLHNVQAANIQLTIFNSELPAEDVDIVGLMLNSHNNWKTLQGTATISNYEKDGQSQRMVVEVLLAPPDIIKIETINVEAKEHFLQLYAGETMHDADIGRAIFTRMPLPSTFVEYGLNLLPTTLQAAHENNIEGIPVVYPHPMANIISSPISELVFPAGLAQRRGEYTLVEEAEILGRPVWGVNWQKTDDSGQVILRERLWIDQQTGIILRIERYSDGGSEFIREEIYFDHIVLDLPIAAEKISPTLFENLTETSVNDYFGLPDSFGTRESLP